MMVLDDMNIKTKFCSYKPIELSDCKEIIRIRSSRNDSVLNTIDPSLSNQEAYFKSYHERFIKQHEFYFKISLPNEKISQGLVRLTELDQVYRFNFQSLILTKNAPPFMAIDAIFTMYELGFERFNRDICGPWVVPKGGEKIRQLHKKMAIATEVMANDQYYFFIVTKDSFMSRKNYFKKLGFGVESI